MISAKLLYVFLTVQFICLCAANAGESGKCRGPYKQSWESLREYPVPQWFKDAKFGIYTHWGVYSVPAYDNEWYPRHMYEKKGPESVYEFHKEHFGPPSEFGYKDFIPMFKAEKFDAEEWAELFKKAGAKFAGPVGEHHDGFAMWDSDVTIWNAADMGPHKDIVAQLEKAIKARGMKYIVSFHHAHNRNYYPKDNPQYDTSNPEYGGLYGNMPRDKFLKRWNAKIKEVLDKYQPDQIWFDFGLGKIPDRIKKDFVAYYYNKSAHWDKEVVITHKRKLPEGIGVVDLERSRMDKLTPYLWQTDDSMDDRSWGYIRNQKNKSVNQLIEELVDIVSKNGILLLNIGPKANGEIPKEQKQRLLGMGEWLDVNGEAIYETRPWKKFSEGESIRFTRNKDDDVVYVICFNWPGYKLSVKSLGADSKLCKEEIEEVTMLGVNRRLLSYRNEKALDIYTPEKPPCEHAFVFKVSLKK